MRVRAGKRSGRRSPIEPRMGSPSSLSPCLLEPHLAQRLVADSWGGQEVPGSIAGSPTNEGQASPPAGSAAGSPAACWQTDEREQQC